MFALISYPVLFEPSFTTHQQSSMWSWSFLAVIALCAFTSIKSNMSVANVLKKSEEEL